MSPKTGDYDNYIQVYEARGGSCGWSTCPEKQQTHSKCISGFGKKSNRLFFGPLIRPIKGQPLEQIERDDFGSGECLWGSYRASKNYISVSVSLLRAKISFCIFSKTKL
ncbi:hypothetical protein GWI33_002915 [Rhynchophorus ferrugineus]|uniref:Uncharacterized protein n=1 Tax=Rhynchophorus ferrugineus TaxID=354439 RepID=A0A834IRC8_RHYFE|nr:hypothetical protein GWI33_002915 [Rhynchophorus ferrugineus]